MGDDNKAGELLQLPQPLGKIRGGGCIKGTGRFIQNQQLGIAIQRFEDFYPLLHAHGQFPDRFLGIDFKPEGIAEFSNPLFMLAEVLTNAQGQINSASQRLRMPNADLPRHLRSIILTVPPSMPKPERELFAAPPVGMSEVLLVNWAWALPRPDSPIQATSPSWRPSCTCR